MCEWHVGVPHTKCYQKISSQYHFRGEKLDTNSKSRGASVFLSTHCSFQQYMPLRVHNITPILKRYSRICCVPHRLYKKPCVSSNQLGALNFWIGYNTKLAMALFCTLVVNPTPKVQLLGTECGCVFEASVYKGAQRNYAEWVERVKWNPTVHLWGLQGIFTSSKSSFALHIRRFGHVYEHSVFQNSYCFTLGFSFRNTWCTELKYFVRRSRPRKLGKMLGNVHSELH